MSRIKAVLSPVVLAIVISGCATSQRGFTSDQYSLSDTAVCRNYINDKHKLESNYSSSDAEESEYLTALNRQVSARYLTESTCNSLISSQNAKIFAGVAAVTVAAAAIKYGGSSGGGSSYTSQTGFAWDAFYSDNYSLIWRCRDKSNGQFADDSSCYGKVKSDTTWPSK